MGPNRQPLKERIELTQVSIDFFELLRDWSKKQMEGQPAERTAKRIASLEWQLRREQENLCYLEREGE